MPFKHWRDAQDPIGIHFGRHVEVDRDTWDAFAGVSWHSNSLTNQELKAIEELGLMDEVKGDGEENEDDDGEASIGASTAGAGWEALRSCC